mmetsp:Transcript_21877/g.61591  ORF Transcript_21877/g.61591 Transcript_21877/m.61591 type:complete len:220 (-) Transcript_21877:37-696(-)
MVSGFFFGLSDVRPMSWMGPEALEATGSAVASTAKPAKDATRTTSSGFEFLGGLPPSYNGVMGSPNAFSVSALVASATVMGALLDTSASISACTRSNNCACCSGSLGKSRFDADRSSVSFPLPASVVQTGCKPASADDGHNPKTLAAATLATRAAVATGGGGGGGPGRGGFFFFSPGGAGGGFAAMVSSAAAFFGRERLSWQLCAALQVLEQPKSQTCG